MRKKSMFLTIFLSLLLVSFVYGGDKYEIDRVHSYVGFSAKHFVISNVKGNFKEFSGAIVLHTDDISKSSVNVTIQVASIDTDNERRDNHLRSADFFEVEKFPEMTFASKGVSKTDDGYMIRGDLTMKGVTKEVSFPFSLAGPIDTERGQKIGIAAALTIDRQEFGVAFARTLANGSLVVSNVIKVELEIEASEVKEGTN